MKLYYSKGACSLSPHIVLREAGLSFSLERVNLATKQTESGEDFRTINPKGSVPALKLDNGAVLTEGPAIVQYLADQKPEAKLAPAPTEFARYQLQEWLNFISTELHKQFSPLFRPNTPDATKQAQRETLAARFAFVDSSLTNKPFLMGSAFTIADAYLFVVLRWASPMGIDLSKWPALTAFIERVGARPAVQAALAAEG